MAVHNSRVFTRMRQEVVDNCGKFVENSAYFCG